MCSHLPQLTLTEVVQGIVGEVSSIVLWGRTGREGSRKIQLWIGGNLLILYTGFLCSVVDLSDGSGLLDSPSKHIPLEIPAILLASGWIGFIYQIFLFNRYNVDWRKKIHLMGYTLAGH